MTNHNSRHGCIPIEKARFPKLFATPIPSMVTGSIGSMGLSGHLWQGRYYSCVLDSAHLWAAARYVERKPCYAQYGRTRRKLPLVKRRAHVNGQLDPLLDPGLPCIESIGNWQSGLRQKTFRINSKPSGRPQRGTFRWVRIRFVLELEARLGRPLRPQKRGPRVERQEADKQGELHAPQVEEFPLCP
jgi:putative transposase